MPDELGQAEQILRELAAMNPLSMISSEVLAGGYSTSLGWYTTTVNNWVCFFCRRQQEVISNAFGQFESYAGEFPHGPECVWQHAVDYLVQRFGNREGILPPEKMNLLFTFPKED